MPKCITLVCIFVACLSWAGGANAKGGSASWHAFHPPFHDASPAMRPTYSFAHHRAAAHAR